MEHCTVTESTEDCRISPQLPPASCRTPPVPGPVVAPVMARVARMSEGFEARLQAPRLSITHMALGAVNVVLTRVESTDHVFAVGNGGVLGAVQQVVGGSGGAR